MHLTISFILWFISIHSEDTTNHGLPHFTLLLSRCLSPIEMEDFYMSAQMNDGQTAPLMQSPILLEYTPYPYPFTAQDRLPANAPFDCSVSFPGASYSSDTVAWMTYENMAQYQPNMANMSPNTFKGATINNDQSGLCGPVTDGAAKEGARNDGCTTESQKQSACCHSTKAE